LRLALLRREIRIPAISQISTAVELLVAGALERGANVDECVAVYGEGPVFVAGVEDLYDNG
jgi:hypothetical protein